MNFIVVEVNYFNNKITQLLYCANKYFNLFLIIYLIKLYLIELVIIQFQTLINIKI